MPTFPPCPPDVPEVLNPLDPRHSWLLFKWVFFQPSKLKHYLYRADSAIYQGKGFLHTLRRPAYRNLYLVSLLLTALLSLASVGLGLLAPGSFFAGGYQGLAGLGVGVAVAAILGAMLSATLGTALGVVFGIVLEVSLGAGLSLVFSMQQDLTLALVVGMVAGISVSMAWAVVWGMPVGAASGFVVGTAAGMVTSLSAAVILLNFLQNNSLSSGVILGGIIGLASAIGSTRFPIFVGEWLWLLLLTVWPGDPARKLGAHPVVWDEYSMWPLFGGHWLFNRAFSLGVERSLELSRPGLGNPFQRWLIQRSLTSFLAAHPDPLAEFYHYVQSPLLEYYLVLPLSRGQFRRWPAARGAVLAEIGGKFMDTSSSENETLEIGMWLLTAFLRRKPAPPLSGFSAMLYQLLAEPGRAERGLVSRWRGVTIDWYGDLLPLPHGPEIANSFFALDAFLKIAALPSLAEAYRQLAWVDSLAAPWLHPVVIEALRALGDVSREVETFQLATSVGQQSAALNRAAGSLNELGDYVQASILPPEQALFQRVIRSWASLIAGEQGKLGEAALREMTPAARRAAGIAERTSAAWQRPAKPFDNPYVVGNPVVPPLFVGRTEIFNRIGEVWSAKETPDSIIVFGHRRMGKSSILRNLEQAAPAGSVVVYADMAGETSFVASTADLLLGLADRVYAVVSRSCPQAALPRPTNEEYATPPRAQRQFGLLLEAVQTALAGRSLILALDEFEALEAAVRQGKIGAEIYQFLRAKSMEPHTTLVFGGLHTLDEMSRDYQQPFYGSYANIQVSYLSREAAWKLVTNPTEDFSLNYEPAAVERIILETGGQPYLVQQVCRDALDHLNHELFDEHKERPVQITRADVDAVLGPDFFRRGTVYFDGVWTQVAEPARRELLRRMAGREGPWAPAELESMALMDSAALKDTLEWAQRHDILRPEEGEPPAWGFYVPLLRRWVRECAP